MATSKPSSTAPQIRLVNEEVFTEDLPGLPPMAIPQSPSELARLANLHKMPGSVTGSPATIQTREARTSTASWHLFQAMLGVLTAISLILATRFLLLLAVAGAAFLAWQGMQNPTWMSLSMTGAFDIGVVMPIVWLYLRRG